MNGLVVGDKIFGSRAAHNEIQRDQGEVCTCNMHRLLSRHSKDTLVRIQLLDSQVDLIKLERTDIGPSWQGK